MSHVVGGKRSDFVSLLSLWYTVLSFNKTSLEGVTLHVYQTYIRRPHSGSRQRFEVAYNKKGFYVKSEKPTLCMWMLVLI